MTPNTTTRTVARANAEEARRIELARVIDERMKRDPAEAAAAHREHAICRGFTRSHRGRYGAHARPPQPTDTATPDPDRTHAAEPTPMKDRRS